MAVENEAGLNLEWHKILAIILHKHKRQLGEVIITAEDVEAFRRVHGIDSAVVAIERSDGMHLKLMTDGEAEDVQREIRRRMS